MLKAYAVALALTTATPVADKNEDGANKAPIDTKEVATQTNSIKPNSAKVKI